MYEKWLMENLPSKKSVTKAGELIKNFNKTLCHPDDLQKAIDTLSSWRAVHDLTMTKLLESLKRDSRFKGLIFSRRLKRMPSIVAKLRRWQSMNAARIQDIAGVRVVTDTIKEVYTIHNILYEKYKEGRRTSFILKKVNDYIISPKQDGYRSLHMIFQHTGIGAPLLRGLYVELQIRTKIQHTWSTAVETFDLLNSSAIKAGDGEPEHKKFFILSSAAFSIIENTPTPIIEDMELDFKESIHKQLTEIHNKLHITDKLLSVRVLAKDIKKYTTQEPLKDSKYFLLVLELEKKTLSISFFKELRKAQEQYQIQEKIVNNENKKWEVVLISLDDINTLKEAYPNYLLDASLFVKEIRTIINKK